jgi:hypothetical protein
VVSIRFPRGRKDMPEAIRLLHVPPAGKGVLPPLQPPGTLFSHSFYLDVHEAWQQRAKILAEAQVQGLEGIDKQSGTFLFGKRMSDLLLGLGARHRIVFATQNVTGYKLEPVTRIPSFAFVAELRDPDAFAKGIEPALRSIGLLGGLGAEMKIVEEQHGDHKIVGYRFTQNAKNRAISDGVLYNFSPCFVRVGDQMIFSSTLELARRLVETLVKEGHSPRPEDSAALRAAFSWQGLGAFLSTVKEQLVAQTILNDGSTPAEARKQVDLLMGILDRLGHLESSVTYEDENFHWDFRIVPPRSK